MVFTAALVLVGAGVFAALSLAGGSTDEHPGLSPKKVAELRALGVTPKRYAEQQRHAREYTAALEREPPPDPKVVGPRLVREENKSQFAAWISYYANRMHMTVDEHWTTEVLSETHTIVTLQLVTSQGQDVGSAARWALNFALTRPLTEAEQQRSNGPQGIKPLDVEARRLSSFPRPLSGVRHSVRIFADETLSPSNHELLVTVFPAAEYEPNLIVRHGEWDEALSRGQILARRAPGDILTLALAPSARFYEQNLGNGRAGPVKRSSVYKLARLFKSGPVFLVLGWRHGARSIRALLRRPVQEVIILTQ